jgi:hypothetical protein
MYICVYVCVYVCNYVTQEGGSLSLSAPCHFHNYVPQFPRCPCLSSPHQLPIPNSTGHTEAAVTTAPSIVIATTANSYSGLQSARVSTCSHATYQILRLDGSQKVHVHSHPHLQGLRLVARPLPSVVPAGDGHSFQQIWTEAGVVELWTGPAQK